MKNTNYLLLKFIKNNFIIKIKINNEKNKMV